MRKVLGTKVSIHATKSESARFIQDFQRRLHKLDQESEETEHKLDKLKVLFEEVNSATVRKKKTGAKKDVLQLLEEKFGLRKEIDEELIEAKRILSQIESKFGNNRAASAIKREAKNLISKIDSKKSKIDNYLIKKADDQDPYILSDDNPYMTTLIEVIEEGLDGTPKGGWGKFDEYRIGKTKKGIRFTRFMQAKNIPLVGGGILKNGYFVASSDINKPKSKDGFIDGTFTPLVLTFTTNVVNPTKLTAGYKISTKKHIENALAYIAYENNLGMFNGAIKVDGKKRRQQLKDAGKLLIIDDSSVKVRKVKGKQNKIQVLVPNELSGADNGEPSQEFIKDLFVDIKRYTGLPMDKRTGRLTSDRLRYTFKLGPKNTIFTFTVLPVKPKVIEDPADDLFIENENETVDDLIRDLSDW